MSTQYIPYSNKYDYVIASSAPMYVIDSKLVENNCKIKPKHTMTSDY